MFLFGGKAADAATSHLAASQRSSIVVRRSLFTPLGSFVWTLPNTLATAFSPLYSATKTCPKVPCPMNLSLKMESPAVEGLPIVVSMLWIWNFKAKKPCGSLWDVGQAGWAADAAT